MRSKVLDKFRVDHPLFGKIPDNGFDGFYQANLRGLNLNILATSSFGWEHVSVSVNGSFIPPSWAIMSLIKDLFWGDEVWVFEFHPPRSEYVNNHPGCLHLWRPTEAALPTPPSELVGIKSLGNLTEKSS